MTAVERHVDERARRAGVDAIAWRRAHVARRGQVDPRGQPVGPLQLDVCLDRLAEVFGPVPSGRSGPSVGGRWAVGRGVAVAVDTSGAAQSPAVPDTSTVALAVVAGTVEVTTAVPDMGTGLLDVLRGVVSAELGVDRHRVRVRRGSLPGGGTDPGAFGSRTARVVAAAAVDGAARLRTLARSLGPTDLDVAVAGGHLDGRAVVGRHTSEGPGLSASAVGVEVVVDRATGVVRPRRVVSVLDIGTVLDPVRAEGQVVGAIVQGLGVALHEVDAPTLLGQGLATTVSEPTIEVHLLPPPADDPSPRGLGELAIMAVPGAVLNAVRDAVGRAPDHLPATPDRILAALVPRPEGSPGRAEVVAVP